MEEIVISLTINKWMLYIVVVALFASFISNMMTLYTYYLKRQLAKEKTKHENSGLHIADVSGSLRDKIIDMLEDKRMTTICGVDENMYYLSRKESADYLLDIFDIREKQ